MCIRFVNYICNYMQDYMENDRDYPSQYYWLYTELP